MRYKRNLKALALLSSLALVVALLGMSRVAAHRTTSDDDQDDNDRPDGRIQRGFEIAPVPLDFHRKNRALVGLGSYIVNAQGGCNDCHTCPSYTPGHNPFNGVGDGQFNPTNYLAGGVPFGPVLRSANLTPDPVSGKPENLTLAEFVSVMRTGHDPDVPGHILQVMPWPVYRHMVDRDLRAIYEYLRAIPHAEPGHCTGAGQ